MVNLQHRSMPLGTRHSPHNWEYADATARTTATGIIPDDVGKLALQLDTMVFWVLIDDSPLTWQSVTPVAYTDENSRDAIATALVAGNLIDITVNDGADTITIDVETLAASDISDFDEAAQDAVGAIFTNSSSIDITYTDATPSISASIVVEWMQDFIAAMITGGSHTGLTVNYNDPGGVIDLTSTGGYTDEDARDAIGVALTAGNNIDITVNDAGDTITIDVETLTSADISDLAEFVRDTMGVALTAGNNIDITVNDAGDTITIDVEALTSGDISDFTEAAQDAVAAMIIDTASINFTYTDGTPELKADVIFGTTSSTVAAGDHTHSSVKMGLTANIGGAGVVIPTGACAYVKVPHDCTVTGWEIIADVSGSIVVTVSRAPTSTPTTFTEISGSSDPTLSSAITNKDTSISGDWSDVTLDEGDWLKFLVTGTPATVTQVAVALDMTRTI